MRLLLLLRDTNWLAVFSLILLVAAPIATYFISPENLGLALGASGIGLAVLATIE